MYSETQHQAFLALARAAIHARVEQDVDYLRRLREEGLAALDPTPAPLLEPGPDPSGVFVTLHRHGQLRGCIGHLGADRSIESAIVGAAVAAACEDPRFPPVGPGELPTIALEISVLTPLDRVNGVDEIEVGRDGLVIEQGMQRGLLLPQVATEWGWDRETFLAHACLKAGLDADAWRHDATIWRFQAEVFGEGP